MEFKDILAFLFFLAFFALLAVGFLAITSVVSKYLASIGHVIY